MKILVIQSYPVPCHFIPRRAKLLLRAILEHVILCNLHETDEDSQASKTTGKIKILFICNFFVFNIIVIVNFTLLWQIYSFINQRARRGYADPYPEFPIYDDEMCHEIFVLFFLYFKIIEKIGFDFRFYIYFKYNLSCIANTKLVT